MRVSKRSNSHDSTQATVVPLTSTRSNDPKSHAMLAIRTNSFYFTKQPLAYFPLRDASCHVTRDTD